MNKTYLLDENPFADVEQYYVYFARFNIFPITLIFPFYSYVYRKNRERDETTAVFLIVNHFYKMLKYFYVFYIFLALWMTFCFDPDYYLTREHTLLEDCIRNLLVIFELPLIVISETCYIFSAILACQRFLMYYWSWTEKYMKLSEKGFKWANRIVMAYCLVELILTEQFVFAYIHIAYNIFLLFSAMLYIPIWFSLRKHRHLVSAQLNQPQRYVLWQLVSIVVFKFIYTPIFFAIVQSDIRQVGELTRLVDIQSFVFIIQLSYLGCNRRNLMTLLSSFKSSWKLIFCPWVPSSQVGSREISEETTRSGHPVY